MNNVTSFIDLNSPHIFMQSQTSRCDDTCNVFASQLLYYASAEWSTKITFALRCSRGEMCSGHGRLCVFLSLAAFPHYCTDLDVSWRNARWCPLVVHCWADLQSMDGFRCYDNIVPNTKCQRVLVLALCLVCVVLQIILKQFWLFRCKVVQKLLFCRETILLTILYALWLLNKGHACIMCICLIYV